MAPACRSDGDTVSSAGIDLLAGSEGSSSYLIGEGTSSQQLLLSNRRYFIKSIQSIR